MTSANDHDWHKNSAERVRGRRKLDFPGFLEVEFIFENFPAQFEITGPFL